MTLTKRVANELKQFETKPPVVLNVEASRAGVVATAVFVAWLKEHSKEAIIEGWKDILDGLVREANKL